MWSASDTAKAAWHRDSTRTCSLWTVTRSRILPRCDVLARCTRWAPLWRADGFGGGEGLGGGKPEPVAGVDHLAPPAVVVPLGHRSSLVWLAMEDRDIRGTP